MTQSVTVEPRRLALPKTAAAQRWARSTDAFRATLRERRTLLAEQVKKLRAEMAQIDAAVEYLDSILPPKAGAPITSGVSGSLGQHPGATPIVRGTSGGLLPGVPGDALWKSSESPHGCADCGRIDVKHIAHGRCGPCDSKWRNSPAYRIATSVG